MPVNTAALKTFAPAMRRQLLEAVGRKLDLLLNSQTPDTLSTYAKQIAELREQEEENREQLLERVAYTWFNRLCALRYLDARGWHPFGCKVLMPAAEGETQPELLKLMRAGHLPAGLQSHTNESRLHGLIDGLIQPAIAGADPQGEVYRELVLATCRLYHELLPNLFEGLDDATELLLPDDLLTEGSITGQFRSEISDGDCQDVETIGWLYQFYICEKKDEVMAARKAVPTEDIPAVTQLFTPHWIVRYLVENSLGRLWLLNRPGSKLRDHMPFYVEGEDETDYLVINRPEEIKLLDPACGSGHILTYAFDLLVLIYNEEGYSPAEIPGLILQHNLYGLEICPRAAQLAELVLVFKAREQSRRFFQEGQLVCPQIIELQEVEFEEDELNCYIAALGLDDIFDLDFLGLLHQFREAKNFGSLIHPCVAEQRIGLARRTLEAKSLVNKLHLHKTHLKILRALQQAESLSKQYECVALNPPYLNRLNGQLKLFAEKHYGDFKSDLFAAFVKRATHFSRKRGFIGLVTPNVWMYLKSHLELRNTLLGRQSLRSLIELSLSGFSGATVQLCAYIVKNKQSIDNYPVTFVRLADFKRETEMAPKTLEALRNPECEWLYRTSSETFRKLPGNPVAYWIPEPLANAFIKFPSLGNLGETRIGLITGDNARYIRLWHEIEIKHIGFGLSRQSAAQSRLRWFPQSKGGDFRRWYGNHETVVDWSSDGNELQTRLHSSGTRTLAHNFNLDRIFQPAISWTKISSGIFSARLQPNGFLFNDASANLFIDGDDLRFQVAAFLNSSLAMKFLEALNPTLNFLPGNISSLPFPGSFGDKCDRQLVDSAKEATGIARADWDNLEISWDFRGLPMLGPGLHGRDLEASWDNWDAYCVRAISRMQKLETENNQFFINAYEVENELDPHVSVDQITLTRAEVRKDIADFLSYATGCMMGRYSLDQTGLIIADAHESQAEQLSVYEAKVGKHLSEVHFKPDPDGIIPVLDGEWFDDDIVARAREFLAVTFPESSVAENLRFIDESLGKDIRKYFCSEFYKDHLQTYKKRPIYWMVQSPKKGFSCLIYLHRYTKDTLNQVLNNYFRPYLQKLEARLAQLGLDQLNDDLPARDRTAARKEAEKITKVLKECQAWEQDSLLPLAQQRIELDLDDGVKVNYLKLQDVLAPIPGLAAKED